VPGVNESLLVSQSRVERGPSSDALSVVLNPARKCPLGVPSVVPRESGAFELTRMMGPLSSRETAFTTRARILPVPDAIAQSDRQGQLAPT
jgi:hypothetical protein